MPQIAQSTAPETTMKCLRQRIKTHAEGCFTRRATQGVKVESIKCVQLSCWDRWGKLLRCPSNHDSYACRNEQFALKLLLPVCQSRHRSLDRRVRINHSQKRPFGGSACIAWFGLNHLNYCGISGLRGSGSKKRAFCPMRS